MKAISILRMLIVCLAGITLSACTDWMYDDRSGCEHGVWLNFKYDYNLQRADMIDHVGSIGVFVYDEEGRYVTSFVQPDMHQAEPYRMYFDLPEGRYRFIALADQHEYEDLEAEPSGMYLSEAPQPGDRMEDFSVMLKHVHVGDDWAIVDREVNPLDTLWYAISEQSVYVPSDRYAYDTLSLVRDTKSISISLREIDHPERMDVDDYTFSISHRNLIMNCNPSRADMVADLTASVAVYAPYMKWNTSDDSSSRAGAGRTAHADFMTARLYDDADNEATLTIRHRESERTVIEADLCNLIGQLRNYDETQRYTLQEFLDRGYDFRLTFFLQGGEWQYTDVSIGILGWSKRIQNVSLD